MNIRIIKKKRDEILKDRPAVSQHVGSLVNFWSVDYVLLLVDNEFVIVRGTGFYYRSNYSGDEPLDIEGSTVEEIIASYPYAELVGIVNYTHDYVDRREPYETIDEITIIVPED